MNMKIILLLTFLANEAQAKMRFCRGRNCNNSKNSKFPIRKAEIKSDQECLIISKEILNSAYLRHPEEIFSAENPFEECAEPHDFLLRLIIERYGSVFGRK